MVFAVDRAGRLSEGLQVAVSRCSLNIGFVCIGFEKHGLLLSLNGRPIKRKACPLPGSWINYVLDLSIFFGPFLTSGGSSHALLPLRGRGGF